MIQTRRRQEKSAASQEGFHLSLLRMATAGTQKLNDAIRRDREVPASLSASDAERRLSRLTARTVAREFYDLSPDEARRTLSVVKAKAWLNALRLPVTLS